MPKQRVDCLRFDGTPINLAEIHRQTGIHYTALSRMFSGQRYPKVDAARKIAGALGLGFEEFLTKFDNRINNRP